MATTEVNYHRENKNARLGNLKYGTWFTDAPNCPDSFYIKVDKKNLCAGVKMHYPSKHSLALNVKTGSVRAIDGKARVTVVDANCSVSKADINGIYKDQYFKGSENC